MNNKNEIPQDLMDEKLAEISITTSLLNTPETDMRFGIKGTFNLFSTGMKANYGIPDLEMRGIPGMLINSAAQTINEINACRLLSEQPILVNQKITWTHGDILTEQGDDWDGGVKWKAEDMIRLTSAQTTIDQTTCECCESKRAGIDE